jgi:hypothetical protein
MVSVTIGALDPPTVGDTQRFNVFGHGFFTGYYPISATLQATNENSYIFVEDAKINDIDINVNDDNKILLATESGVMYTDDGGATWTHVNGATDLIPEGTRSGGADAEAQHRSTVESVYFYSDDDWMAGVGRGHLAFGDMVQHAPYRSKDAGVKWSSAGSGCPSYKYDNVNDETSDYATVFEMANEPTDDNNFFGASRSGVLSFEKRKWATWPGAGLPQITAEWDHLPVYDILYDTSAQVLTAATEHGVYMGTVDLDNEQVSWLPIGNGTVPTSGVSTFIDSALVEYEMTTHDTTSLTFSDTVFVSDQGDGTFSIVVDGTTYLVNAYDINLSNIDLIVSTTILTDSLDINAVSPRVLLSGDDVLTPNQWVTVNDAVSGLYWVGKARFADPVWYVDLNEDNQYFGDATIVDPDTIDYTTWLPIESNLVVSPAGAFSISSVASDGTTTYAGADHGIYSVSAGGALTIDSTTAGMVVNDMLYANSKVLAATDAGLFQLNSGEWTKVSPLLTDGYTGDGHEYDLDVRSIAVDGAGNLYFGGPLGGLYKSVDNGLTWSQLNSGLTHRAVTLDQVNSFSTTMDANIYSDLQTWLGDLPNVDGDDKVYTLLYDIDDLYYNTAGDGSTYIKGEILVADQVDVADTLADANSNARDIIYVDINPKPADDPLVAESAAFQLGLLISHNADADEDDWVKNGLAGLGSYIVGLKDVSGELGVLSNNSLTLWGDASPIEKDYEHTFIFMEYLYEQYFTTATDLKAFMSDTLNGISGLQSALSSVGSTDTFSDIYANFGLAIHFDGMVDGDGNAFGAGKYNVANLILSNGASTLDWGNIGGDSPYGFSTAENSIRYFKTHGFDADSIYLAPGLGDNLVFNMDDVSEGRIFVALSGDMEDDTTLAVHSFTELSLNDHNLGIFSNLSDFDTELDTVWDYGDGELVDTTIKYPGIYNRIDMFVVTYDAGTINGGSFVMHDLDDSPEMMELGISQSTLFDEYIDIYGFSDARIFDDGGMLVHYDIGGNAGADLEGPEAVVTNADGDTLFNETLAHFHIDDLLGIFGYRSSFELPQTETVTNYTIGLVGENVWGGRIASSTVTTIAVLAKPGNEILLMSEQENAMLRISTRSLKESSMITMISNPSMPVFMQEDYVAVEDKDAMSDLIQIGPSNIKLNEPVSLTLSYDEADLKAGEAPQVYEMLDGAWTAVPGYHNAALKEIRIETERFGSFQIRKADPKDLTELPLNFALHGNYPNPFNPTTTIKYDLATESMASLVVYNLLGQEVVTLVNSVQPAGYHSVVWNGQTKYGTPVSSGVYLMRLNTDKGSFNHKMVYLK